MNTIRKIISYILIISLGFNAAADTEDPVEETVTDYPFPEMQEMNNSGKGEFEFFIPLPRNNENLRVRNSKGVLVYTAKGEDIFINQEYLAYLEYFDLHPDLLAKPDSFTVTAIGYNTFHVSDGVFARVLSDDGAVAYHIAESRDKISLKSMGRSRIRPSIGGLLDGGTRLSLLGYLDDGESMVVSVKNLKISIRTESKSEFTVTVQRDYSARHYPILDVNQINGSDITTISFARLSELNSNVKLQQSFSFEARDSSVPELPELADGFNSETYFYTATVSNRTKSISISPKAEKDAVIQINNGAGFKTLKQSTARIPLEEGENNISIRVKKQGVFDGIYKLKVTREGVS